MLSMSDKLMLIDYFCEKTEECWCLFVSEAYLLLKTI